MNPIAIVGLLNILGVIAYFVLTITQMTRVVKRSAEPLNIVFKVIELVYLPIALLISGLVLLL